MGKVNGWAVCKNGVPYSKTTSNTRRAAIINWLYTYGYLCITARDTDEQIEEAWQVRKGTEIECSEVEIIVLKGATDG